MLLPDLLWSKEHTAHFAPRRRESRAPSRSWAAVDGPVDSGNAYFLSERETVIAEVVRCETVPKKSALPFGAVVAGRLVIWARVVVDCVMSPHWAVYHVRDTGLVDEPSPCEFEGSASASQRVAGQ